MTPRSWNVSANQPAQGNVEGLAAAAVGDLAATTAVLGVRTAVTTAPVSRSLTLGVLRDFLASAATGFAAVAVTVASLAVGGASIGIYASLVNRTANVPTAAIAYSDQTIATAIAVSGAMASFDASPTLTGNFAWDHFNAFQSRTKWTSVSGSITDLAAFFDRPDLSAGSTHSVTHRYGVWVRDYIGTDQVGTTYGVKIDDLTLAGANYAIMTGLGLVQFGDEVTCQAPLDIKGGHVLRWYNAANDNAGNISCPGGSGSSTLVTNASFQIGAGSDLILGRAYVPGVVAATGTVAVRDSSGTSYNVLVHT